MNKTLHQTLMSHPLLALPCLILTAVPFQLEPCAVASLVFSLPKCSLVLPLIIFLMLLALLEIPSPCSTNKYIFPTNADYPSSPPIKSSLNIQAITDHQLPFFVAIYLTCLSKQNGNIPD